MLWTTIKNIFKDKTCIFSWHFFLKTTILKWETNKLELKNKNQNTIIKTKQTMFEYKSMLLFVFCFKNNHFEVRNQQTWIEKQKSIHNNQSKTNHVRKQKHALFYFLCLKTTILKWEKNRLELKSKNQITIIKTKQTMFESKNMLLSDIFCIKKPSWSEKPTNLNWKTKMETQ